MSIWASIIGQERVKRQLLDALRSGRLPHAYLFFGAEGVGKDAMALELARVVHCERKGDAACGECASCIRIRALSHPDVKLICALPRKTGEEADDSPFEKLSQQELTSVQEELRKKGENPYYRIAIPKANVIKINSIRETRKDSALSTFGDLRRFVIISRTEEMSEEASNSLLKNLEEPSGNTMFILTTSQPDALLPTLQSRCQKIRFDLLMAEEIQRALVERRLADEKNAELIARLALGSYGRALELLDEDIARERKEAVAFVMNTLGQNFPRLMDHIEEITSTKDKDVLTRFLTLLLIWFRDALVLREGRGIINVDQHDELVRFIRKFPNANLVQVLEEIEKAISLLQRNVYIVLVFVQLSIKLKRCILQPSPEPETVDVVS